MTKPRFPMHTTVWTWFESFPDRSRLTRHEIIGIRDRAGGYNGASNYGYRVSPLPRGAAYNWLDEGWFLIPSESEQPSTTRNRHKHP